MRGIPEHARLFGILHSRPLPTIPLILTKNCFSFNDNHYVQIHGTAMGIRMAPSFANLSMERLECEFLLTQDIKPQEWWKFIDDIFVV